MYYILRISVNEAKNQNIASYCYDLASDMTKNGCYNPEELKKDTFVVDVDVMGILASSSGTVTRLQILSTGCFILKWDVVDYKNR